MAPNTMRRIIMHVDMDAFFASIEQRDDPVLRGKPVAVGGGEKRGVVAAASYEARAFGVHSAMPGYKARQSCSNLIFVKPRFTEYKKVSQQIRGIFEEYTDTIEPIALDEAYLDVSTQCTSLEMGEQLAREIKHQILNETQLTASAGISYNKFLAKLASDLEKPDGLVLISKEKAESLLPELDIRAFPGIGKVTEAKLHKKNIYTGRDLARLSKFELSREFGKLGSYFYNIVRGIDDRAVQSNRIRKSVGVERTYNENLHSLPQVQEKIPDLSEKLFARLKKHGVWGKTLTLKIKDAEFNVYTRQISVEKSIDSLQRVRELTDILLHENQSLVKDIRLLGLTVSNFHDDGSYPDGQLELKLF